MRRPGFDLVVDAVHYKPGGEIDWVRAYERRGATFSDLLVLSRSQFIEKLTAGKKAFSGKRVLFMASTFDLGRQIYTHIVNGKEIIVNGQQAVDKDCLQDVPVL